MKTFLISVKIFLVLTIITGIIYPITIFVISQLIFPTRANGSLIEKEGRVIGSVLIGQNFDSSIYFTSRPSAIEYNPFPSGGSNLALTNSKLIQLVKQRKKQFIDFNHLDSNTIVPSEMLFSSASGLDPHISIEAALLQVNRICEARNLDEMKKKKLVDYITSNNNVNKLNPLGINYINVLLLNLELDNLTTISTINN
jgi:potassium-transporting ATPase KdpC subunit